MKKKNWVLIVASVLVLAGLSMLIHFMGQPAKPPTDVDPPPVTEKKVAATAVQPVRQLTWDDLIPANLPKTDPIEELSEDQRDLLYWVIHWRDILSKGGQAPDEGLTKELSDAVKELNLADIDIEALIAKRDEIRTSIVEDLNGRHVRIPGYLLPLDVSGALVTEFLLVPWVGACIHTPPPPPNQIVHVKTVNGGYKTKTLFDPVWVTGVFSAKAMVAELYLVDGSADIDIGYALRADTIEPYEE